MNRPFYLFAVAAVVGGLLFCLPWLLDFNMSFSPVLIDSTWYQDFDWTYGRYLRFAALCWPQILAAVFMRKSRPIALGILVGTTVVCIPLAIYYNEVVHPLRSNME